MFHEIEMDMSILPYLFNQKILVVRRIKRQRYDCSGKIVELIQGDVLSLTML